MKYQILLILWLASPALGQTYTIRTFAGGGVPNQVLGTSVRLSPLGIAVDAAGNVYFSDTRLNVVYRLDAVSHLLTVVAGNGTGGFSGDGGPAAAAQLSEPIGVAVGQDGSLYIADTDNYRIRKVAGGVISTFAGNGMEGFSGDGGAATNAELEYPGDVAIDRAGNLYIADGGNNRIREVSNGVITTIAGNGNRGFSGDGGPATQAELSTGGIAVDTSGNLYIADAINNRIREVSNGVITTVAGNGRAAFRGDNGPAASASLNGPSAIAIDDAGDLFIADAGNNRIREVINGVITTVAGDGVAGFAGDNGPATGAELQNVEGIAVDSTGEIYICDEGTGISDIEFGRIREISGGKINTVAGGSTALFGENGPAINAQLQEPQGVAMDASGNVYIADIYLNRVLKVSNGIITTLAGNGVAGFSGDNGPATDASLNFPYGVAVDSAGNVYIADSLNNRVRKVANGVITTVAGNGQALSDGGGDNVPATSTPVVFPMGVAVDSAGNLYVVEGLYRVRKVSNGIITTVASAANNGSVTSNFFPEWVAVDSTGSLYITNTNWGLIYRVSNGVMTTFAGSALGVGSNNVPATSTWIGEPSGVAVDTSGNVYFAAGGVREVSNGVVSTIAGGGSYGYIGDGGPALSASVILASGLTADPSFNVYVSDSGNHRVRMLIPSGSVCPAALVSPTSLTIPAVGGSVTVSINVSSSCTWAVQDLPSWVSYSGNDVGSGTSSIALTAPPNLGSPRTAQVSIADMLVMVTQAGLVPSIAPNGIVPLDSTVSTIQPGSWVSIFGSNLTAGTFFWNGDFPTKLGDASVTIDGELAYLSFVSPSQINLQAPDDTATGPVTVAVTTLFGTATATVTLAAYAPSLITFDSRYAAAVIPTPDGSGFYDNGSYDLAGPSGYFTFQTRPAKAGETIELYGVGFGPTNPPVASGGVFNGTAPTVSPVTVTMGGVEAAIQFAGLVSAGVYQLNVVVPNSLSSGDQLLKASVGGVETPASVFLAIQ